MTAPEKDLFQALQAVLPDQHVAPQVAMNALLDVSNRVRRGSREFWLAFDTFSRQRVDFVLSDKNGNPHTIVELDDGSHATKKGADALRDARLRGAGYRVVRLQPSWKGMPLEQLQAALLTPLPVTLATPLIDEGRMTRHNFSSRGDSRRYVRNTLLSLGAFALFGVAIIVTISKFTLSLGQEGLSTIDLATANGYLHTQGLELARDERCRPYALLYTRAAQGLDVGARDYAVTVAARKASALADARHADCLVRWQAPRSSYLQAIWATKRPKLLSGGACRNYPKWADEVWETEAPEAEIADGLNRLFTAAGSQGCMTL